MNFFYTGFLNAQGGGWGSQKIGDRGGWKVGSHSSGSHVRFDMDLHNTGGRTASSPSDISVRDGDWHVVEAHFNGTCIWLVVDSQAGEPVCSDNFSPQSGQPLLLGNDNCCEYSSRYFSGQMKDVCISRARAGKSNTQQQHHTVVTCLLFYNHHRRRYVAHVSPNSCSHCAGR